MTIYQSALDAFEWQARKSTVLVILSRPVCEKISAILRDDEVKAQFTACMHDHNRKRKRYLGHSYLLLESPWK